VLVQLERHDAGVALVTLNDPARRNAMTEEMGDALKVVCREIAGDADIRSVVLTGAPPAFSAGGDLAMLEELGRRTRNEGFNATDTMRAFYNRFLVVRDLPQPVEAEPFCVHVRHAQALPYDAARGLETEVRLARRGFAVDERHGAGLESPFEEVVDRAALRRDLHPAPRGPSGSPRPRGSLNPGAAPARRPG
jgi:hypothetical protein